MINDLAIHSPLRSSHWKYVDDIAKSEVTSLGEASSLQNDINCISQWAQQNNMNLNPLKMQDHDHSSPQNYACLSNALHQ